MNRIILVFTLSILSIQLYGQNCEMNAGASQNTIHCGECVTLNAFGQNTALSVLNEDFNTGGFGPGWSSTPGAVNFSNPCSGGGVDGTPHAWMDDNTSQPRDLVSAPYDFSTATAGVSICFDLLYAIQGNAAPCEGPDEPDEGVYLEYSIDGGANWVTINYFDPLGGNNPQLTNWNNYCFDLPLAAITSNTLIRWHQDVGSGAAYDHWGIDNVQIFMNDVTSQIEWIADAAAGFPAYVYPLGSGGGDNPTPVCPSVTTTYTAQITTGNGDVCTATTTIIVNPIDQINVTASASPTSICTSNGECSDITATAEVILEPAGPKTFENIQPFSFSNGLFGSGNETVNVNVQGLNMPNVNPGSIQSVCIDFLDFHPSVGEQDGINDLEVSLMCPSGTEIILVAMNTGPEGINGGLFGTDQPSYYQNVCFVPAAGQYVSNISNGSAAALPVTGNYLSADPLTGLDGCTSNGVWEIHLDNNNIWGGNGTLTGWSITFMDDPLLGTPNFTWSPSAPLSDANSLTPEVCTPGTYTITVDNGNVGCGTQSASVTIVGATGGDASFTTTDYCEGQVNSATIIGDTGGTFAFNPIPTDGATINSSTGEISNGVGGTTYTIEYTTPGSCSSSSTQTVNVNQIYSNTENVSICSGSNYTYPDGVIHNNISADESYVSNLTTINGCDSIVTTNVTVTLSSSTENINICSGSDFTYPDGTINTNITANESHVSNLIGITGCDSIVTTNINVLPNYSSSETASVCAGDNYTFPDGATHNNLTIDEVYTSTFIAVNGCDSSITTTVTVNQLPNVDAGNAIDVCEGTPITLTGSGASNYVWDNGVQDGITFTPPIGTTTYTVTGTDANGCINTDQVSVTNNAMPIVDFTLDTNMGCLPLTINFTDNTLPSGVNCVWDFGNGTTSNICGSTSYTYAQSGIFDVTYTVIYPGNCSSSLTYSSVLVDEVPQAIFNVDNSQLTIENTEIEFENNSINANTYEWNFGDNSANSGFENPTHIFPSVGNEVYIVTLIASNDAGCSDTTQQTIHVDDVIIYYVPNVFTPDGDAYNQIFQPVFTSGYDPDEYHLIIFNRWGEIVFESYNAKIGWDGTYPKDGKLVEDGVYVWKINFKETMSDKKHEAQGHVTVLR
jgi:gliding motility-associated-like protein